MKLFLSSIRLPNSEEQMRLFGDKENLSVAVIPNARDRYPKEIQDAEVEKVVSQFKIMGFKVTIIDLVTSNTNMINHLNSYDFVWMMGGNSFHLNYRVKKRGFDDILKAAIEAGLVYGGASAGAVLATPTLRGVENMDNINDTPGVFWDALSLVEFGIIPHWGEPKYQEQLQKMKDELSIYVPHIVTLDNTQAAVIIDDKLEIN